VLGTLSSPIPAARDRRQAWSKPWRKLMGTCLLIFFPSFFFSFFHFSPTGLVLGARCIRYLPDLSQHLLNSELLCQEKCCVTPRTPDKAPAARPFLHVHARGWLGLLKISATRPWSDLTVNRSDGQRAVLAATILRFPGRPRLSCARTNTAAESPAHAHTAAALAITPGDLPYQEQEQQVC
jgi:hypothetical protein